MNYRVVLPKRNRCSFPEMHPLNPDTVRNWRFYKYLSDFDQGLVLIHNKLDI